MKKLLAVLILIFSLWALWYFYIKPLSTIEVVQNENVALNETANQTTQISNSENPAQEVFRNHPGKVISIINRGEYLWSINVDILSPNPKWLPGVDGTGPFFINIDPKIRNLNITPATRAYVCGAGPDGNETTADVLTDTKIFIDGQNIQNRLNDINIMTTEQKIYNHVAYYFDINGANIGAIYQQCLP